MLGIKYILWIMGCLITIFVWIGLSLIATLIFGNAIAGVIVGAIVTVAIGFYSTRNDK